MESLIAAGRCLIGRLLSLYDYNYVIYNKLLQESPVYSQIGLTNWLTIYVIHAWKFSSGHGNIHQSGGLSNSILQLRFNRMSSLIRSPLLFMPIELTNFFELDFANATTMTSSEGNASVV